MASFVSRTTGFRRDTKIKSEKAAWGKKLDQWTHEINQYSIEISKNSSYLHPRQTLGELERAMPKHAMVSTDIGNVCSVSFHGGFLFDGFRSASYILSNSPGTAA